MKRSVTILLLTIFISFNLILKSLGQKIYVKDEKINESSNLLESIIPNGQWFYLAYIDSSVINKSIFKYSWSCASLAYMISYDSKSPDSIFFKGYNEEAKIPFTKKNDRVFWAGDNIQHWIIAFNQDFTSCTFKEYVDPSYAHKADPEIYSFTKRNIGIETLSMHFVKNILKGNYKSGKNQISITDKLISKDDFSDYYEINGLENAKTFSIVINFWEMVPQMDLINLFDKDGKFIKQYNWSFDNDELILRNVKEIYKDGDFAGGEAIGIAYRLKKEHE